MKRLLSLLTFTVLNITTTFACENNLDCEIGSKCLKQGIDDVGVCIGGMSPGNAHDDNPVYNSNDRNDKIGRTCDDNSDCDFGRRCFKTGSSLEGTCY